MTENAVRLKWRYGWRYWLHLLRALPGNYRTFRAVPYSRLLSAWLATDDSLSAIYYDWKHRARWPEYQRLNDLIDREAAAALLRETLIASRDFERLVQHEVAKAMADSLDRAILGEVTVQEEMLSREDMLAVLRELAGTGEPKPPAPHGTETIITGS